jgi:stearoyl-CoA desaturase (delta-9 desaturase)
MFDRRRLKPLGWERWAMDMFHDPELFKLHVNYWKWGLLGLLVPALIGAAWYGSWAGWWAGLLWGGLLRVFVANQMLYCTNSLCHTIGSRMFDRDDNSRNLLVLAPLSLGLTLHNNHHAFPASASLSFRWWQLDITGALIRLMEKTGLAWDVRRASVEEREQKIRSMKNHGG